MKNYLLIIMSAIFFAGCGGVDTDGFRVSGKLENGAGITVYIDELTASSIIPLDSTVADADGNFKLEGKIEEVGFYKIRLAQNNFVNIILNPQDDITLSGDATYLYGSYTVEGSPDALALYELNEYLRIFGVKTDSIRQVAAAFSGRRGMDSVNFTLQNHYNKMLAEKNDFLRTFVDENSSSLASLSAIEGLSPTDDGAYFVKLDKKLNELYPNSPYVKSFHIRAAQIAAQLTQIAAQQAQEAKLVIGAEAPQILLNNTAGETVPLSSLRGKIVLIDFWASWCKPCRRENPAVVRVYDKYKGKGFEIYGVSLDRQKGAWLQAIRQDGLEWIHVSDLGFWNSAAAKLYNINSIPQTYLLDKDGKIIAKGLRAAELEKKLAEILG